MVSRGLRKERAGLVVSDRMPVMLDGNVFSEKILRRRTKVKAHDERGECRVGDRVLIVECRPLSRDKRWRVSKVLERAQSVEAGVPSGNI